MTAFEYIVGIKPTPDILKELRDNAIIDEISPHLSQSVIWRYTKDGSSVTEVLTAVGIGAAVVGGAALCAGAPAACAAFLAARGITGGVAVAIYTTSFIVSQVSATASTIMVASLAHEVLDAAGGDYNLDSQLILMPTALLGEKIKNTNAEGLEGDYFCDIIVN